MSRRPALRALVLGAAAAAVGAAPVTSAAPPPAPAAVVSGPQSATVGFAPPTVLSVQGQGVTLLNADTVGHTVTSLATRAKRVKIGKRLYTIRVPLFDTGDVAAAATGEVKGVTGLKPGSYAFFCTVHPAMKGQLVVNPGS